VSIEGLIVSIALVALLSLAIDVPEREMVEWPLGFALIVILVMAPVFETLVFQVVPITVARILRRRFKTQVLISVIPFAALHFLEGIPVGVGAGLIGGFYLAFTYVHWVQRSFWTALWTTTVSHAIRNSLPALALILYHAIPS